MHRVFKEIKPKLVYVVLMLSTRKHLRVVGLSAAREFGYPMGALERALSLICKTHVAVFSEEAIAVRGLKEVLEETGGFEVEAIQCPVSELASRLAQVPPGVVLLDVDGELSLAVITQVVRKARQLRVVLWGRKVPLEFVHQAMEAGVKGLLPKKVAPERIVGCLATICEGGVWFERDLMQRLLEAKAVRLTRRERELLLLVTQRLTNREIARALGLAEGTVRFYLSRLFKKVLVSDRLELASYGARTLLGERAGPEETRALVEAGLLRFVIAEAEGDDSQACG